MSASSASMPRQVMSEEDQAKEQYKPAHLTGARPKTGKGKKTSKGKTDQNQDTSDVTDIFIFDNIYNKKGRVQVFPDYVESKVTLFKKADTARDPGRSRRQRTFASTPEGCAGEASHVVTEGQQRGQEQEKPRERSGSGNYKGPSKSESAADKGPQSTIDYKHTASARQQVQKKAKAGPNPKSFVLDTEKLKEPNIVSQLKAEDCELLVLKRTKAALEAIADPDDPPVFLLHNQDLVLQGKADKTEGEKDLLVLHPILGVLVLEVKSTEKKKASRLNKATAQLLHAQASIQEEMGDLLEEDAVVLTIALPNLQPEDSSEIKTSVQESSSTQQKRDVIGETRPSDQSTPHSSDSPPATSPPLPAQTGDVIRRSSTSPTPTTSMTSPTSGKNGGRGGRKSVGARGGGAKKFKEGTQLSDHPEVRLLPGSTAKVYTEWVRQLQQHRATSSHAFRGSTDQERLDNFKRACIRRCSVPALRPGQSVKDAASLYGRWVLTEEQLRVRDSQGELLHLSGPPGSGKTLLLAERGRRWLREGRRLALAVGKSIHDLLLRHLARTVCGEKADLDRVSTHTKCEDLLEGLYTASSEDPVSVILDEAESPASFYTQLLHHVRAGRLRGLWTAHTRPLPDELETALQRGGSTVRLTSCLRCPPHVMALTNSVREEEAPELLPPQVPLTRELGVEVELISHPDHSQFPLQSWHECPACRDGVLTFFSGLGLGGGSRPSAQGGSTSSSQAQGGSTPSTQAQGSSTATAQGGSTSSALSWRDVIVLITGGSWRDPEFVAHWLQGLGLPALAEKTGKWRYSDTAVLLPGKDPHPGVQAEDELVRSCMLLGEDKHGRPALHVAWHEDFLGLEKKVLLLWHGDEWDEDRDKQSQKDRDDRLCLHRRHWFQAASRCQGRLVVMATTPSPLLPLLSTSHSRDGQSAPPSSSPGVKSAYLSQPASPPSPVFSPSMPPSQQ